MSSRLPGPCSKPLDFGGIVGLASGVLRWMSNNMFPSRGLNVYTREREGERERFNIRLLDQCSNFYITATLKPIMHHCAMTITAERASKRERERERERERAII